MKHIVWLRQSRVSDADQAGGKGANLGELIAAGFAVPDGFVVTKDAYLEVMANVGVGAALAGVAGDAGRVDRGERAPAGAGPQGRPAGQSQGGARRRATRSWRRPQVSPHPSSRCARRPWAKMPRTCRSRA